MDTKPTDAAEARAGTAPPAGGTGQERTLAAEPDTRRLLSRARPYLTARQGRVAGGIATNLAATLALTATAPVIGRATDALLDRDRGALLVAATVFAALVLARFVLQRLSEVFLTTAAELLVRDLRDLVAARFAGARLRFPEAHRHGDLLRRGTTEIADLASFVHTQLPGLLTAVGGLAFAVALLCAHSLLLTAVLLAVFLPPAVLLIRWYRRDASTVFAARAERESTAAATFREGVAAREALQAHAATGAWQERYARDNAAAERAALRTVRVALRAGGVQIAQGCADGVLLVVGGVLVHADRISVGTVVVFAVAMRQLFDSFNQLNGLIGKWGATRIGLARLLDLLEASAPAGPPPRTGGLPRRGELVVDAVQFGYVPGVPVLRGLSLHFAEGEVCGIVGPTGSGKTTLAELLCGLYAPDAGSVRYAGHDLHRLDEAELRPRIALVGQDVHLVAGSVAENIALASTGGEISVERIERAVEQLGLSDWIGSLPAGLDTPTGRGGSELSAGEGQLIGLIRAALLDPAVLILDEATAAVDPRTAAGIEEALPRIRGGRTLLVVAHRPATIARLPRLVHLDAGGVRGTEAVPAARAPGAARIANGGSEPGR